MIRNKIEECFYTGVEDIIKYELTKSQHENFNSIVSTLLKMESFLLQKLNNYDDENQLLSSEQTERNCSQNKKYFEKINGWGDKKRTNIAESIANIINQVHTIHMNADI
ncbi:hypothetical protein DMUE_5220 [Dictyocoela muelleri]|nr:hypothetical protein DMUE_5220 [Dictyocoela muelleri]